MACHPSVRSLIGTGKTAASLASTAAAAAYHHDEAGAVSELRNACDWLAQALAELSVARDYLSAGMSLTALPGSMGEDCTLRHAAVGEISANGSVDVLVGRARSALRQREACNTPLLPSDNPTYREDKRAGYAYAAGRFEAYRETLELLRLPVAILRDLEGGEV